jgi:hypothetical protein
MNRNLPTDNKLISAPFPSWAQGIAQLKNYAHRNATALCSINR